jgi:EAL domain-containing protein (putative c-di-GMP-specific phosphodiesterase class I)
MTRHWERDLTAARVLEHDRLERFFPALLGLTLLFAAVEAVLAVIIGGPAFAAACGSTCLFALGLIVAGHQIRAGKPFRARAALAVSLTVLGVVGTYLIPDVGVATALLPIVSVVLVLPHVQRRRLVLIVGAGALSVLTILVVDALPHLLPSIGGGAGTAFADAILLGIAVLVLAGLADFAVDARESLDDLRASTTWQIQVTGARLAIVASLRTLHAQITPEATAGLIVEALGDLPLVDVAVVVECVDGGLTVLAVAGTERQPIRFGDHVPAGRARYLLERSANGAWAELWKDRPGTGLEDERLTAFGTKGQAFAPIVADGELVGLVMIATANSQQAAHLVADLPSVSEAAAVAGAILAPALLARGHLRIAKDRIALTIEFCGFHPVFQPIVNIESGQTVGFEALTRFASGAAPDQMFADAARAGLGAELEAATLAAAVRQAVRLPVGAWLSLNVSPAMLSECDALIALLADRTRPIVLEITEHEVIDDYAPLHAALRRLGPDVRLAVDDAGAGVANFRHLVDLRPDQVKIDAGLVRGVNADLSRQALVVGLVHFAAVAGAVVIAEGIETEAERATLQALGVTFGQGYLLARPAPVDAWLTAIAEDLQPRVAGNSWSQLLMLQAQPRRLTAGELVASSPIV